MIRSKALVTLFTALAAFGCAAIVNNEQVSRHEVGRQGAAGLDAWERRQSSGCAGDQAPLRQVGLTFRIHL